MSFFTSVHLLESLPLQTMDLSLPLSVSCLSVCLSLSASQPQSLPHALSSLSHRFSNTRGIPRLPWRPPGRPKWLPWRRYRSLAQRKIFWPHARALGARGTTSPRRHPAQPLYFAIRAGGEGGASSRPGVAMET